MPIGEIPIDAPPPTGALAAAWQRLKTNPLAHVGPGLITGVADDDPSGIATYSQAGAQFGLNMLWTMPLAYPLMAAIQSICARIGRVTGKGLAANIKTAFPAPVLRLVVLVLLIANTLNIAADVAAMGEVSELVTHVDRHLMTVVFVLVTLGLQMFVPYHRYVRFLKWLTLSLLAYAAVLFTVHVPWDQVALRTVWPQLSLNAATATMVVGIFGTTISPYLFFWQAAEEVEDEQENPDAQPLTRAPEQAPAEMSRIRVDTYLGMAASNLIALFIIITTAATLNAHGVKDIQTSSQAAEALRPIAGEFAFAVFAAGIIGTGLLALPVLAGSAAYALGEARGWPVGLARKPNQAKAFYGAIAAATLIGAVMNFTPIDPIKALFWSAVINGVAAAPIMAMMMLLTMRRDIMGGFTLPRALQAIGWIATIVMGVATVAMIVTAFV